MGWSYLFMPKLQQCGRWSLEMNKLFHSTLSWACDYLSMLGLKFYSMLIKWVLDDEAVNCTITVSCAGAIQMQIQGRTVGLCILALNSHICVMVYRTSQEICTQFIFFLCVCWCGWVDIFLYIFFRVTSVALGQSQWDCPIATEVTLENLGKWKKMKAK